MESADCDINQPCGPHKWENLQRILAPEYRLKTFQFKTGVHRLTLHLESIGDKGRTHA